MGLSCFKSWKHDSTGHKAPGRGRVAEEPQQGVWIPFTGVFGQRLEETVLYERRYGVRLVPLVVEQCVNFIRERGLQEVGLFRQPGQSSLLYLRQLPEPLVPHRRYQDFLLCAQKLATDGTLVLGELRSLLHELPVVNFNLLNFICQFLYEVQSYSSSNKMSGQNLATVFGPNILRAKAEDPQSIMGGAALVQVLMLELIREHESLFAKIPSLVSARPPGGSHASPSALRQPHLHPTPCLRQLSMPLIVERSREPGQSAADPQNSSCIYSAAAESDLSSGQKRRLGHRYTSSHPENCFYPLPSSSTSERHNIDYHQGHAGRGPSPANLKEQLPESSKPRKVLLSWAKDWPKQEEAGTAYWSSDAAEEHGEMPGSFSGGSSEDQEESNLSAYDNMDRAPGMEDETNEPGGHIGPCEEEAGQIRGSSSSWSSCEVLPLDESSDAGEAVSREASPKTPKRLPSSQAAEKENSDNDDHEDNNDDRDRDADFHHPTSLASGSLLSESPLSTGSSEVFLPSGPPDHQEPDSQPGDVHSLLAELQDQMNQQKAEYQARMQR
ncbi:hypothetical protein F7725_006444 [Dissostichus mawsoni]|uniref:Rho-GAP domain-containing protein n=1 Tax=Dissostichus mawsoni TaxID=36200 RepID=A0A7J5XU07_DISMA|nr:hypothetical protein F7725_006444 [Dissostichus mawsoni]